MKIFPSSSLYVKIYRDEMEVTYLQDDVTIRRQSSQKFSTDRMLIADYHAAKNHLQEIIKEIPAGRRLFTPSHVFLMQHMIDLGGGMCEVEKRTLRDIGEQAGGKVVYILPHTKALSAEEAMYKLTMGLKGGAFVPPDLTW
ncbi:hypothetical protein KLP40_02300 [Hymenobacter sp. NST-14]|uniref:hypothetical protein n=1 Tax=Hymenobacter piscis TaxID=2839984 RepID=UPI001C01DA83|nr:hypothetical protein [Hymenobacter piscis]MBT9391983.1 hypothetical protein [Hymenobacter piscis]